MDEVIFQALMKYFTTLQRVGYVNYDEVYKILQLLAIKDIADTDVNGELKEEDFQAMYSAINCIMGSSCLFPYPASCNCVV